MKNFLFIYISTLLMTCTSISDLNKPENFFEGNFLPIGKAIYDNDPNALKEQLEIFRIPIDSVGKGGITGKPTFLMYAIFLQNEVMVNTLLELGADANKVSLLTAKKKKFDPKTDEEIFYYFQNPLNYASGYIKNTAKAKKISGLLIDHGADVNGWGEYYNAPLENAVILHSGKDAKEMIDFFLSKGANINGHLNKSSGSTLLMSIEGEWELVDYLLDSGADPRFIDFTGWDFMWNVDARLKRGSFEPNPSLEALKKRLIKKYNMSYPPTQNKAKGDSLRRIEYKKKGWTHDENGKLIIPEDVEYYNELRRK